MKKQKKIVAALTIAFALFAFAAHTVDYRAQQVGRVANETVCAATEEDNFADNAVIVTLKSKPQYAFKTE